MEFRKLKRLEIIEACEATDNLGGVEKRILDSLDGGYQNCSDTELAAHWFRKFGEVVLVGDSRLHLLIKQNTVTSQIIATTALLYLRGKVVRDD